MDQIDIMDMKVRLTPRRVAQIMGVSAKKVRVWITTGQIKATNVSTDPAGRPRYRISPEDLTAFQEQRQVSGNIEKD